jgi:hypothetical protein
MPGYCSAIPDFGSTYSLTVQAPTLTVLLVSTRKDSNTAMPPFSPHVRLPDHTPCQQPSRRLEDATILICAT